MVTLDSMGFPGFHSNINDFFRKLPSGTVTACELENCP